MGTECDHSVPSCLDKNSSSAHQLRDGFAIQKAPTTEDKVANLQIHIRRVDRKAYVVDRETSKEHADDLATIYAR